MRGDCVRELPNLGRRLHCVFSVVSLLTEVELPNSQSGNTRRSGKLELDESSALSLEAIVASQCCVICILSAVECGRGALARVGRKAVNPV